MLSIDLAEIAPQELKHKNPPPFVRLWGRLFLVRQRFLRPDCVVEILWIVHPLNVKFFLLLVQNGLLSGGTSLKSRSTVGFVPLCLLAVRDLTFS